MRSGWKPGLVFDLGMEPRCYWETYGALKHSGSLIKTLDQVRLEALARLVRELSENAHHHGDVTSPGRLCCYLPDLTFELRIDGPAFDSKKHAAALDSGGLHTSNEVLARAGGTWSCMYESGQNVYKISFDGAPHADGESDDLAE